MSISPSAPVHPLLAAVRVVDAALDDVAGVDPLFMSTRDKKSVPVELTAVIARVTAMRAGVLAVADDLAASTADRSPGTWLAAETRTHPREAIADERLGGVLRDRWPLVAEAVCAGRVTWQQAGIVTRALDDLPADLDPELTSKAEAQLLAEAGQFGPAQLTRLGRKVLEVIAPDLAEDHEHRLLLAAEHRARAATQLSLRPRGDGTTDLYARLPDPVADTTFHSMTVPKGTWLLTVTATVFPRDNLSSPDAQCHLKTADSSSLLARVSFSADDGYVNLATQMTLDVSSHTSVGLVCNGSNFGVNNVTITAIEAGSVSDVSP